MSKRSLLLLAATVLIAGSIFALRMAVHVYTHHEHVDVFHLVVGTIGAALAVYLVRQSLPRRR